MIKMSYIVLYINNKFNSMLVQIRHSESSESLRQLFKENKVKIQDIAKQLGVHRETVSNMLKNEYKLPVNQYIKLLNLLGYEVKITITKK
jgi:plasmid maintenance system antidote protein VapI